MNEAVKTKWLDALRSGKYEQTTGQLRHDNTFCCLGVLCDLYSPKLWKEKEFFLNANSTLPVEVVSWAGLSEDNPNITRSSAVIKDDEDDEGYVREYVCLAEANDSGLTFAQIADIIEKEL